MTDEQITQTQGKLKLPSAQELIEAGVHFGHKTSRWQPKMEQYIHSSKGNSYVFDLEITLKKIEEALIFLQAQVSKGGIIIFVGTKPAAKKIVKETAQALGAPYVNGRWLGGTLTNFKTITKRLQYWKDLAEQKASGGWEKYTKKECLGFQKQIDKLQKQLEGIKDLNKLPDVLFAVDVKSDNIAVREAKKIGIPIVAICDTNVDPTDINFVIPANDDASSALKILMTTVVDNLKNVKSIIAEPDKKNDVLK